MDRKLEIRRRRCLLVTRILFDLASLAHLHIRPLRLPSMVEIIGFKLVRIPSKRDTWTSTNRAAFEFLRNDSDADVPSNWHALRQIPSLSVLRLPLLGDSFSPLARGFRAVSDVRFVGATGVGLECVSQYECEFAGSCPVTCFPGFWCFVEWPGQYETW